MKKILFLMIGYLVAGNLSAQNQAAEEKAIGKVINTLEIAIEEKDGGKYASVFAETHDFIAWNGMYFPSQTRQQTAAAHQRLFEGPLKAQNLKLKIDKIRFVQPDIATAHVLGAGYEKGTEVPEHPGFLMTLLMEKKSGNWQVTSFHNLDLEVFQNKEMVNQNPEMPRRMYANWYKE